MTTTESRNQNSLHLDQMTTLQIVQTMNAEDATVPTAIATVLPTIAQAVDAIVERLRRGGRLFYIGAGTSGRLGVLDAAECVPTFSTPPETVQALIAGGEQALVVAVENAEDDRDAARHALRERGLTSDDAVVGIAASGSTPYVLGGMAAAKAVGAVTIGLACNVPSPLLEAVDIAIGVAVGPEVLTGSTRLKAGTAQKLVLNMLSTASMVKLGKVYGNLMVDVGVTNAKLQQRAERIVAELADISTDEAADLLRQTNNRVKPAVVMALLGVDASTAQRKLDAADGHLRLVLGDTGQI